MHWHDVWWRRVTSFWSAWVEADAGSLHNMIFLIFHDAIQLAFAGCKFSWAAQVFMCFSALGEPLPLGADPMKPLQPLADLATRQLPNS